MQLLAEAALVALQCLVVVFAALQNWIRPESLYAVKNAKSTFTGGKRLAMGFAAALVYSPAQQHCTEYSKYYRWDGQRLDRCDQCEGSE